MKKILFLFAVLFTAANAIADNYDVTVSTKKFVQFVDAKTGEMIGETTEPGNAVSFEIVAKTPREAEDEALNRCGGTCSTGVYVTEKTNISYKGHICNKLAKTVPYKATATLSTKSRY